MSIIRVKKRPYGFVIIDRRTLADERLTWAARGLLAYLLSLPDDWRVRTEHLAGQAPDSDYKLRQALSELQAWGYARVEQRRRCDGKLDGSEWIITERPELEKESAEEEEAEPETDPDDAEESSGKPYRHIQVVAPKAAQKPDETGSRNTEARTSPKVEDHRGSAISPPLHKTEEGLARKKTAATGDGSGAVRLGALLPAVNAADASEEKGLVFLLTARGMDAPVARQLVQRFPEDRIRRQVANYDQQKPNSVGWLVKAIEQDYSIRNGSSADALTYQQMLRWCEDNGGLHRTAEFESIKQPDGSTRFRRSA